MFLNKLRAKLHFFLQTTKNYTKFFVTSETFFNFAAAMQHFATAMEQKKTITISLIIPVYKVTAYIERCLKSVFKQTYNHFECILVDDASPDDSIAKCEQMIANYDGPIRFRILHHEKNRGLSAARNTGIDAATGDYILFIDSDDIISSDCVEKLMAPILEDDSLEMVFGGWMKFSEGQPLTLPVNFKNKKEVFSSRKKVRDYYYNGKGHFVNAAWNKLIRKSFLTQYGLRFKEGQLYEDALWTFFVLKHLSRLCSIPDVTYFYCQRDSSICSGTSKEEELRQKTTLDGIIATHLTLGDEGREAAHYAKGFTKGYLHLPKTKALRATARRFSKALPFFKYPVEKTLLWAAIILPHNHWGRQQYKLLAKWLNRFQK